jgi:hypothetical protein
MTLVEKIKKYANEHYEESYGAQTIVECFNDAEIAADFTSMKEAKEYMSAKDEQMANCW